jgi:isoprenylcysteine carboxyl methyltransferase (ICMT) family protein YpbQ
MLWPVFVAIDIASTRSHYFLYRSVKTPQKFNNIVAEIIFGTCLNYTEQYLHTYMKTKMPQESQLLKRYGF